MKRVVLVGHCGPDSSYLRMVVAAVAKGVQVVAADTDEELRAVLEGGADLLLLNRLLEFGFEEHQGVCLIERLRQERPDLKTMLVSNYADAQAAAVKAGALPGFGKRDLGTTRVRELLRSVLDGD